MHIDVIYVTKVLGVNTKQTREENMKGLDAEGSNVQFLFFSLYKAVHYFFLRLGWLYKPTLL